MKFYKPVFFVILLAVCLAASPYTQTRTFEPEEAVNPFESCTSILVGRMASADGSTMTSHSCDSGTDRTWINIVPHKKHDPGDTAKIYFQSKRTRGPDDPGRLPTGKIPQVPETYAFINTAYPVMNEYQLAIGETTIGGRRELKSDKGIIDAPELYRLLLQRAKTAREAIRIADELTKKHGYTDYGECFTFADPKETWHFEIFGPGKGQTGAVWAAQRVPDDEIGMSANASRIRQIDLDNIEYFMASENIHSLAIENGWWSPDSGNPFEVCYAYAPGTRTRMGSRRREWRVLSLLAPSLELNPHSENYPFSVKPDKKVTVQDVLNIFRDTYENTEFDMTKDLLAVDSTGQAVKSPIANPHMNNELRELFRIQRERTICSPRATYVHVTQSRDWLPDMIGGVVWLGYDNPATTPHTPFYCGITRMPDSYQVDGRRSFSRDCAWWSFRRVSKLAAFRWQHITQDIAKVWEKIENRLFENQADIEAEAQKIYEQDPARAQKFLTDYCVKQAEAAVAAYWELGDDIWVKYSLYF